MKVKGFTLIEVFIILSIFGILLAASIPKLKQTWDKSANKSKQESTLKKY